MKLLRVPNNAILIAPPTTLHPRHKSMATTSPGQRRLPLARPMPCRVLHPMHVLEQRERRITPSELVHAYFIDVPRQVVLDLIDYTDREFVELLSQRLDVLDFTAIRRQSLRH